jgi:hypothetical protein
MPPAASRSTYIRETIDSTINLNPCIALDKPVNITFVFHPFLETTTYKQWPPLPVQDVTDRERLRSEVIPLGVKLKVTILSIHS